MQKSPPKEKVVDIYERFFLGQDITQGRAEFWNEFFLLKVNFKALLLCFDRISKEQLIDLKPHMSRLYSECTAQISNRSHWLRVANAIHTIDCLVQGVFSPHNFILTPEDRDSLLFSNGTYEKEKFHFMELSSTGLLDDLPLLLKEMMLNSMTIMTVACDDLNGNPLLDWLVNDKIFKILLTLISDTQFMFRFGVEACRILGILTQYDASGKNIFVENLSQLTDETLLNNISTIISFALSNSNRKFSEQAQSSAGILASITNLLGNLKSGDNQRKSFRLHDDILLCLYAIVLHNPLSPSLITCSHTHTGSNFSPPDGNPPSSGSQCDVPDTTTSFAPELRNLLADLIEYTSVVIQGTNTLNTANLCFKILSKITKDPSSCGFLFEYNIHFAIHLHKARLRHRKPSALLQDRGAANTMAAVMFDLLIEFISTHLMKSLPFPIFGFCLDTCYNLLSHQKEHSIRLDYDWRQLWKALFDLSQFLVKNGGPLVCFESYTLLRKTVGIFNFFITLGDDFLEGPDIYDELYYELIRMSDNIEKIYLFAQKVSTSEDENLKAVASSLVVELENIRTIEKHFDEKIVEFTSKSGLVSLTESQVFDVIRGNYESLSLRIYDDLHTNYGDKSLEILRLNDNSLIEFIHYVRKSYVDTALSHQLRFSELSVIL